MEDLIIRKTDSRFKYLDKIMSYDLDDLIDYEGPRSIYYFIPPWLVITPYRDRRGKLLTNRESEFEDDWTNWVSAFQSVNLIRYSCEITVQDFYDLCFLHINDRSLRPRCSECGGYLNFNGRLSQGYNSYGPQYKGPKFCSNSCQASYHGRLNEGKLEKLREAAHRYDTVAKQHESLFINLGDPSDHCYLYLAKTSNNLLKFGATKDIPSRVHISESFCSDNYYDVEILFESNRIIIARLERMLKIHFESGEYLPFSYYDDIKSYIRSIVD